MRSMEVCDGSWLRIGTGGISNVSVGVVMMRSFGFCSFADVEESTVAPRDRRTASSGNGGADVSAKNSRPSMEAVYVLVNGGVDTPDVSRIERNGTGTVG